MRGRGTKAEGRWKIAVPLIVERAIVRDYCTPGLTLAAIEAKYGVTEWTVNKIRLKWGLRRYQTNAKGGVKTVWDEDGVPDVARGEPVPTVFRCPYCGGRSSDAEGHSACITRNAKAA